MLISLEEINPFERQTINYVILGRQKGKTGTFINVIYKLIYLLLKIQEIFPSRLANLINKLVHAHSFVYLIRKSLGKYFLYF